MPGKEFSGKLFGFQILIRERYDHRRSNLSAIIILLCLWEHLMRLSRNTYDLDEHSRTTESSYRY